MNVAALVTTRPREPEAVGCSVLGPATSPDGLYVKDLQVTFRTQTTEVPAVRGVSFTVPRGRTLVLLGESGSGKSVTARSILRLYGTNVDVSGRVRLGSIDLSTLEEPVMRKIRGRSLSFVPQDASGALDPLRRIGPQISEVLRCHGVVASRREARERAEELLRTVGIADPVKAGCSYPHELSGGMRQRALIAIGIACGPDILIADEPTTALDVTIQAQILDLFAQLQASVGMGLLLVTHDVGVARQVADRVAVMYAGRLVEEGPGSSVFDDPTHPYTRGLLGAVPTRETPKGRLQPIPGLPPGSGQVNQTGCAFGPRCPDVQDACRNDEPRLISIGDGRRAACAVNAPAETPLAAGGAR
jgi:oligopeptide/dipeptide ABC transporter ATP-binding protein